MYGPNLKAWLQRQRRDSRHRRRLRLRPVAAKMLMNVQMLRHSHPLTASRQALPLRQQWALGLHQPGCVQQDSCLLFDFLLLLAIP